jgi:hypothetical protein
MHLMLPLLFSQPMTVPASWRSRNLQAADRLSISSRAKSVLHRTERDLRNDRDLFDCKSRCAGRRGINRVGEGKKDHREAK